MISYKISEHLILTSWSIETLVKKLKYAYEWEMTKRGVTQETEEKDTITESELTELEELYS